MKSASLCNSNCVSLLDSSSLFKFLYCSKNVIVWLLWCFSWQSSFKISDYFGEWKMMQYYVRDFFNPIIVTGQLENDNNGKTKLDIFVVSDVKKIEHAIVKVKLGRWKEIGTFSETSFPVTVVGWLYNLKVHVLQFFFIQELNLLKYVGIVKILRDL